MFLVALLSEFESSQAEIPPTRNEERDLYRRHYELLQRWNDRYYLVSEKVLQNPFASQYVDSLYISDFGFQYRGALAVCDFGSGGGFPGVIFAIRYPRVPIRLYERNSKKRVFLKMVATELGLGNVRVHEVLPNKMDSVLLFARAVLPTDKLFRKVGATASSGSKLIVNVGGGGDLHCGMSGFVQNESIKYRLPGEGGDRRALCFTWNKKK